MNVDFSIYLKATGRVVKYGRATPDMLPLHVEGSDQAWIAERVDPATEYVQDGEKAARPALPLPMSINLKRGAEVVLTGLPDPVAVTIDGQKQTVVGGVLVLSSLMPATYRLGIDQWPFLPWNAEVKVA